MMSYLEGDRGDSPHQLSLLHGDDVDVLGPDDHVHRLVGGEPAVHTGELLAVHFHHVVADHGAVENVALADKVGNESILRLIVNVLRRSDLLDIAVVHDYDGIAHGQRLFLVVGYVNKRNAGAFLNPFEFDLHLFAQL